MHVLAFFAASDGIVMENLAVRFMSGAPCSQPLLFNPCATQNVQSVIIACKQRAAWGRATDFM